MDRHHEQESKFDLTLDSPLPELSSVAGVSSVRALPELELTARYVDTADLRLLRRGVTLRHRRPGESGEEASWTLKLPEGAADGRSGSTGGRGSALSRSELSWPAPGAPSSSAPLAAPPEEALGLVVATTGASPVSEVAEVTTTRRRLVLAGADGSVLAEVDDDVVVATRPDRPGAPASTEVQTFRQVEVELGTGRPRLLDAVGRRLEKAGARRSADQPKLAQVLADRLGAATSGAGSALGPASTLGDLALSCLSDGLARLQQHDPGVRLDTEIESVHQARVATRRLRSDLGTFAGALDPGWTLAARGELSWVAGALGAVRDLDVLRIRLERDRGQIGTDDDCAYGALVAVLADERCRASLALAEAMASARYLDLVSVLMEAVDHPPLRTGAGAGSRDDPSAATPATAALGHLVGRRWRRVRRYVQALEGHADPDRLHEIRIRSKQLGYAAEAAVPVVGRPAKRLARAAADLQGCLGDHHDTVAAIGWLRSTARGASPDVAWAAGRSAERCRQDGDQALAAWPAAWEALEDRRLRHWLR